MLKIVIVTYFQHVYMRLKYIWADRYSYIDG